MLLAAVLASKFESSVKERGRPYVSAGMVALEVNQEGLVRAAVSGTGLYSVSITQKPNGAWQFECTCPAFRQWGPCKHLWATIVQADLDTARPKRATPEPAAPPAGPPPEVRPDWRQAVSWVKRSSAADAHDPWRAAGLQPSEWRFELDVDATVQSNRAVLSTRRRKRRGNEAWGTWRTMNPWNSLDEMGGGACERAARALEAAVRDGWDTRDNEVGPGGFRLDLEEAVPILWFMGQSGRLHCKSGGKVHEPPVRVDDGEPWRPGLRWEPASEGDPGRLSGYLQRGEERARLEEPLLLLGAGLVFLRGSMTRFACDDMSWVSLLRQFGSLEVPAAEEAEFVRKLLETTKSIQLELPDVARRECTPRPLLDIRTPPDDRTQPRTWKLQPIGLAAFISFDYDGARVGLRDTSEQILAGEGAPQLIRRDRPAETAFLRRFHELGGRPCGNKFEADGMLQPTQIAEMVPTLVSEGWAVTAEGVRQRSAGLSSMSVRTGIDWFELEGALSFDDQEVPLPELLAAVRAGRRTVTLGDGSTGILPDEWLRQWGWIDDIAERPGKDGIVRVPQARGWLLDALLAAREDAAGSVTADAGFRQFGKRLAAFSGLRPRRERRSFQGTLRTYQREGLGWFASLRELGLGGCLADDMGLGKTVQVLAMLEARRHVRPRPGPSLVVAPRSVVSNWVAEAKRFAPNLRVADLTSGDRHRMLEHLEDAHLVVTTYGLLRRDIESLMETCFDYAILDEAQAIKNASSQSAKAARLLVANHRLALSGTPIENHLGELWSLFEFLNPGMLGRAKVFQQLVGKGSPGDDTQDEADSGERLEVLARAIQPFMLRRTKDEVLPDLPARTDQVLECPMGAKQRRDYDALRKHYQQSLLQQIDDKGLGRSGTHVLEGLLRLRQAACHPGLIDKARVDEPSAKLDVLLESLEDLRDEGHKALVFSQFTSLLDIVEARLVEREFGFERLDGRTRKRAERVKRFQEDESLTVFLVSLKAGGTGLNLTAADYVFLLDPWWNPAVEQQAVDRTHRIGQTRPVMAYKLVCPDTVEERIAQLQEHKRDLADAILGKGSFTLRDMSREDLAWLLS